VNTNQHDLNEESNYEEEEDQSIEEGEEGENDQDEIDENSTCYILGLPLDYN
jgi:hypothetical protein